MSQILMCRQTYRKNSKMQPKDCELLKLKRIITKLRQTMPCRIWIRVSKFYSLAIEVVLQAQTMYSPIFIVKSELDGLRKALQRENKYLVTELADLQSKAPTGSPPPNFLVFIDCTSEAL